jgi:DUF3102 family protein
VSNSVPTHANQADPILASHAVAIRALGKRVVDDVIEIGARVSECKRICGHGNWLPWLEREFGWSADTAERFIQVHALSDQIPQIAEFELPVSALYLLATPSRTETARTEIIERARSGELIPLAAVKRTIETAKGRQQPARRQIERAKQPKPTAGDISSAEAEGRSMATRPTRTARGDIASNSASETERLRARNEELERENHRLVHENIALHSQIEELKVQLAKLIAPAPDDGLDIPACLRRGVP